LIADDRKHRLNSYPPRSPAEWLAEGHVTCSIQCLNGDRKHQAVRWTPCPRISSGRASAPTCSARSATRPQGLRWQGQDYGRCYL